MADFYAAEFMVFSSLYSIWQEEELKESKRNAVERAAARGLGGEEFRRSLEEEHLEQWYDTENRKIRVAGGATRVTMAGAGVDIKALTDEWSQAQVELLGSKLSNSKQIARMGNLRKAEILEMKNDRLSQLEKAGTSDWMLALATGFMRGVQLEEAMNKDTGGWDGKMFGIDFKGGGAESMFAEEANIPLGPLDIPDPGAQTPFPEILGPGHPAIPRAPRTVDPLLEVPKFPQAGSFGVTTRPHRVSPVSMPQWKSTITGYPTMPLF